MTSAQLEARNAAIRRAWDDPLTRALQSARLSKPGSKRSSPAAYNAYYREYGRKRRERHLRPPASLQAQEAPASGPADAH